MRRSIAVLASAVVITAFLFSGCAHTPLSAPVSEYEKLWLVDIGRDGYVRTSASHDVERQSENIHLMFATMPADFKPKPDPDMKTVHSGSIEYLVVSRDISLDGIDENGNLELGGTTCTGNMVWERGNYAYSINTSMPKEKASPAVVLPETAVKLEKDPLADLAGFELKSDNWRVEFKKEDRTVTIQLTAPMFTESTLQYYIKNDRFKRMKEGGIEYLLMDAIKPEVSKFVTMIWKTNKGLIYMSESVSISNVSSSGASDLINTELAKSITEQIGGRILPMDEAMKTKAQEGRLGASFRS